MIDFLLSIIQYQAAEIIVAQETIKKQSEIIAETAKVMRDFTELAVELYKEIEQPTY